MAYVIDIARCIRCGWCRQECPTRAVRTTGLAYDIDADWCIDCDLCAQSCPVDCIEYRPALRPAPPQLERAIERARAAQRRSSPPGRPPWARPHRDRRAHGDS